MTSARYKLLIATSASRHTGARPSKLAQIYGTVAQKLPEPLARNAYRRKTCKTSDDSVTPSPANASCPAKSKAADTIKSP